MTGSSPEYPLLREEASARESFGAGAVAGGASGPALWALPDGELQGLMVGLDHFSGYSTRHFQAVDVHVKIRRAGACHLELLVSVRTSRIMRHAENRHHSPIGGKLPPYGSVSRTPVAPMVAVAAPCRPELWLSRLAYGLYIALCAGRGARQVR
ncbi:hypothetical protein [Micromonospora sp. NPDC047187]|uniref:hypothetical protein n=1 Tax=Micromonospora sp. NPDC047187 TaxID=3155262 RepID=UPI0033E5119B